MPGKLTSSETVMLELLKSAVHGCPAYPLEDTDWLSVFFLANQHNILPLIFGTASQLCPKDILLSFQDKATELVIRQVRRTYAFLDLYQKIKEYKPLIMKGIICRNIYPEPDSRPSNDEDMLIRKEDIFNIHNTLIKEGFHTDLSEEQIHNEHEITYINPLLRLEIHTSLFPEDSVAYGECNELFEAVFENEITVTIEDTELHTLNHTDHLLYLICHAYKHFLHSGVGIRQVCDICLYATTYNKQIDWKKTNTSCCKISIETFTAALFRIGYKYLGFEIPDVFKEIETDETNLLKDILSGGVYGASDRDRLHSSTITLNAAAASKEGRKKNSLLNSIFLPKKNLEKRYPYLEKHPYLLPVAWGQRVINYLAKEGSDPSRSIEIGKERINILKEYGLIDD